MVERGTEEELRIIHGPARPKVGELLESEFAVYSQPAPRAARASGGPEPEPEPERATDDLSVMRARRFARSTAALDAGPDASVSVGTRLSEARREAEESVRQAHLLADARVTKVTAPGGEFSWARPCELP